jgi:hypothetical protein
MSTTTVLPPEAEVALEKLLELPPLLRLQASERLAESVEQSEIDRYWASVGAQRAEEMRTGAAKGLTIDEAFARAEKRVNEVRTLSRTGGS